jgi:hypothetical protein
MLTTVELTVLRALAGGGRTAEDLRLTTPYGVPALLQLLDGLARAGYVEGIGERDIAAKREYVLTHKGIAEVEPPDEAPT